MDICRLFFLLVNGHHNANVLTIHLDRYLLFSTALKSFYFLVHLCQYHMSSCYSSQSKMLKQSSRYYYTNVLNKNNTYKYSPKLQSFTK